MELTKLFQEMFPDSNISKNFQLSRVKYGYIFNHGSAPQSKLILMKEINRCSHLTILFDESLSVKPQHGQMGILIRYWNIQQNLAETRYINSQFLDAATAQHFLENLLLVSKILIKSTFSKFRQMDPMLT